MQSSSPPRLASPLRPKAPGTPSEADESWFGGFRRLFRSKPKAEVLDPIPLLAFAPEPTAGPQPPPVVGEMTIAPLEEELSAAPRTYTRRPSRLVRPLLIVGALVALSTLAVPAYLFLPVFGPPAIAPATGNLTIETRPAGSEVIIDNVRRGVAPLTLALAAGPHTVLIRNGSDERTIPLTMAPGGDVSQYYEMRAAEPSVLGGLSIVTDPPGATVAIDGKPRGVSPMTVTDLPAADHLVTVTSETGTAERVVPVAAGSTAAVTFSLPRLAGPVGGWLAIAAPFEVEVNEREDVIGSSAMTRIMLSAGRHDVVLANRALGYSESRRIEVTAGRMTAIHVDPPTALVSLNARPWAEVILDGESIGQTPIANRQIDIGSHEVIFRHPQYGERKQTVLVTVKGPNRIAVDLSK